MRVSRLSRSRPSVLSFWTPSPGGSSSSQSSRRAPPRPRSPGSRLAAWPGGRPCHPPTLTARSPGRTKTGARTWLPTWRRWPAPWTTALDVRGAARRARHERGQPAIRAVTGGLACRYAGPQPEPGAGARAYPRLHPHRQPPAVGQRSRRRSLDRRHAVAGTQPSRPAAAARPVRLAVPPAHRVPAGLRGGTLGGAPGAARYQTRRTDPHRRPRAVGRYGRGRPGRLHGGTAARGRGGGRGAGWPGRAHPDGGVRLHLLAAARSPGRPVAARRGARRLHRPQDARPAATVLPQGGLPGRGLGADRPGNRAVTGYPVGLRHVTGGAMSAARNDFVIVGGGSAGSALANRLSADPGNRVLVLEAGRPDYLFDVFIHMPAALTYPIGSRFYDWKYESEPEPFMGGRRVYRP